MTASTLTPRMAEIRERVTGCRYAITASVSSAACVSRACCPSTVEAPALGDLPEVDPPAARLILVAEVVQRPLDVRNRPAQDLGQHHRRDRLVDHEQDSFSGCPQSGGVRQVFSPTAPVRPGSGLTGADPLARLAARGCAPNRRLALPGAPGLGRRCLPGTVLGQIALARTRRGRRTLNRAFRLGGVRLNGRPSLASRATARSVALGRILVRGLGVHNLGELVLDRATIQGPPILADWIGSGTRSTSRHVDRPRRR
jgi:hypothetical protein